MPLAHKMVEPEALAPRERSMTRDFLGDTFANQVKPLNGAANGPVDPSFSEVISTRRPMSRFVKVVLALAAVAGVVAYFVAG